MQLAEIQDRVKQLTERYELDTQVEFSLLDLVSELGEVSKELLKSTEYGKYDLTIDNMSEELGEELGDLFYSLVTVANTLQIDLTQQIDETLEKYNQRFAAKGHIGSGN